MNKPKPEPAAEPQQCPKCEGHGAIEGKICDCACGQMLARDAKHVSVAYNHETGKKDVFVDNAHRPAAESRPSEPPWVGPREFAKKFIRKLLQPPLLHGDDKHKEWLTNELGRFEEVLAHDLEDWLDNEHARWQVPIYELCKTVLPDIDGGGVDSGDPLDLTMEELRQCFHHLKAAAPAPVLRSPQANKRDGYSTQSLDPVRSEEPLSSPDEWEFGDHTECPVCGTDCHALWQEANMESRYRDLLRQIEELCGCPGSIDIAPCDHVVHAVKHLKEQAEKWFNEVAALASYTSSEPKEKSDEM